MNPFEDTMFPPNGDSPYKADMPEKESYFKGFVCFLFLITFIGILYLQIQILSINDTLDSQQFQIDRLEFVTGLRKR